MQIHDIQKNKDNKIKRSVGRGGKRGKTSGRGTKGQKARAGHKIRPMIRDIIKKLPKLRGYKFHSIVNKNAVVDVSVLPNVKASPITPQVLAKEKFVRRVDGRVPKVKILGNGEISSAVSVSGCLVSASAKKKIEEAGGDIK